MRIKGVVEKIEGTKLIIELKPRVAVRKERGITVRSFAWELPEKIPKEGSVVRINFHSKDAKDFETLKKILEKLGLK